MKRFFLILLLIFVTISIFSVRKKNVIIKKGELLGERRINFNADKDEIIVGRDDGAYIKLQFEVEGNDVEIFNIIITYSNQERDEIPVKLIFNENQRSRIIDLKGPKRFIKKITFFYKTIGPKKEGFGFIRVFGL